MNRRDFIKGSIAILYLACPKPVQGGDALEFHWPQHATLRDARDEPIMRHTYLQQRAAEEGLAGVVYDHQYESLANRRLAIRDMYSKAPIGDLGTLQLEMMSDIADRPIMVLFDRNIFGVGRKERIYVGPAMFQQGYKITQKEAISVPVVDASDKSQVYTYATEEDIRYALRHNDLVRERIARGYIGYGYGDVAKTSVSDLEALVSFMSLESHAILLHRRGERLSSQHFMGICREIHRQIEGFEKTPIKDPRLLDLIKQRMDPLDKFLSSYKY